MKWLLVAAMVFLGTACGTSLRPAAPTRQATTAPSAGLVYVRGEAGGPIEVVDARAGRLARMLPAGVPAPDWRSLYRLSAGALQVLDAATGLVVATHAAPAWARDVATSANGRWLVLIDPDGSRFQVQDAGFTSPPAGVSLGGRFTFDGVSGDGRRLYLLQWVSPGRYQVRMYDVVRGALSPQVISDKQEVGQLMSGQALASLPTGDGAMQLTLYQRRADGRAFVHVLPVSTDMGIAFCVDLPGPGAGWGFVAGPTGDVFYAVNPSAGLVVQLSTFGRVGPPSVRDGAVDRQPTIGDAPAAAVSPDGMTLYLARAHGLAALDTHTLKVRTQALGDPVEALGIAPDGSALYAIAGPSRLQRIDPRTLSVVGTVALDRPAGAILRVD